MRGSCACGGIAYELKGALSSGNPNVDHHGPASGLPSVIVDGALATRFLDLVREMVETLLLWLVG